MSDTKPAYDPTAREGVAATALTVTKELRWIFREQPTDDWGIDGQIEVVDDLPTGRLIAAQIKSGESFFNEETDAAFVYRGTQRHLDYWRGHSLPVVLVLYDPRSSTAYWEAVRDELVTSTGAGWKIAVQKTQVLNRDAAGRLRQLALPEWANRRKFDYLSSLLNGFATQAPAMTSRLPVLYAALFAANRRICVAAPLLDAGLANALACASTFVTVEVITGQRTTHGSGSIPLQDSPTFRVKTPGAAKGIFHPKFVVVDGLLSILGSANMTADSWGSAHELFMGSTDPAIVTRVQEEFDRLWHSLP